MTTVLAIDPGNVESGWCLIDADRRPLLSGKTPNNELLYVLRTLPTPDQFAIEMVASYGMAVGKEVFETCVWIGRFQQFIKHQIGRPAALVYRKDVKLHHCHDSRAKDANITQALIDRFASGEPNRGKGTKAEPGWFHGFHSDIWQAYALAVLVADREAS